MAPPVVFELTSEAPTGARERRALGLGIRLCNLGFRDNIGIMEKKMETTIMGYIGII